MRKVFQVFHWRRLKQNLGSEREAQKSENPLDTGLFTGFMRMAREWLEVRQWFANY